MSAYLNDDDQTEAIRKWWQENGKSVILGVALGLGGVFGWRMWQQHNAAQAEAASDLYQDVITALRSAEPDRAGAPANEILSDYGGTGYAPLARLALARLAVEDDELDTAVDHLQAALSENSEPALELGIRLRLGRVLAARGDYEQALAAIELQDPGAYGSSYAELKGDILVQQGDERAALEAYEQALAAARTQAEDTSVLEMKLNDLGAGAPASG